MVVLHRRKVGSPAVDYFGRTWRALPEDLRRRAAERALAMLDADTVAPVLDASEDETRADQPVAFQEDGISGVALLLPPLAALAGALYLVFDLNGADIAEIILDAIVLLVFSAIKADCLRL